MRSKVEIHNYIASCLEPLLSSRKLMPNYRNGGDARYDAIDQNNRFSIYFRILEKHNGYEIDQFHSYVTNFKLEKLITSILDNSSLMSSYTEISIYQPSETYNDLHRRISIERIIDQLQLSRICQDMADYIEGVIFPFFKACDDYQTIANYLAGLSFEQNTEFKMGGEYPIDMFKKIAILKWGGLLDRYEDYKKGLLVWFEEDENDPNYKDKVIIYRSIYSNLIKELEHVS